MDLGLSGLASGFDWKTLVDKLATVERQPQTTMRNEQLAIQERNNAFSAIRTSLGTLQSRIEKLQDTGLFDSRTATSSDTDLATVTATEGAALGSFRISVSQLATASRLQGTANAGAPLSATSDVSGLSLDSAGLATAITAGTFSINGQQVTVESTDTLGAVFAKIAAATNGDVTASYDPDTDKVTLTSGSPIVLGSATDTSNFIQALRIHGNNAGTLSSDSELGSVRLDATIGNSNLATAVTGGAAGQFSINGVSFDYDTTTDSLRDILGRINASSAGVIARYDSAADRFVLTNKETGSTGIALEDGAGSNFLQAVGWIGGTLETGKNLLYSVDGGSTLTSRSNTISESTSGLTGLNITALAEDTFTIDVGVDSSAISKAVTDFVDAYNTAQSQIDTYTLSSTDAQGKVTAGALAGDSEAIRLASQLRGLANKTLEGLGGSITSLSDLGIASNGYDDKLSTTGISSLDNAIAGDLESLRSFFADSTEGWAVGFGKFLESSIGDDGSLTAHQTTLTKQADGITTQIQDQEKTVQAEIERLTASFVAMESAQAKSNQQLAFLTKTFA